MSSIAKRIFDSHISECREALVIFDHLERQAGFTAEFSLRFVWIAAVSAMDHYVSRLIIEKATFAFGNKLPLQAKLLSDMISFSNAIALRDADPVNAVLVFRTLLDTAIRFKSFQHPDKISDGLSYIWPEKHKWKFISNKISMDEISIKRKLSSIIDRRNLISHNGDYDETAEKKLAVSKEDAREVVDFIARIVSIIDDAVP